MFKKMLTINSQLLEVVNGKRGWFGITEASKHHGVDKDYIIRSARQMGLDVKTHGKYGYIASRPLN